MDAHPFRLELDIDWSEIDAFGHINNLAIQRYVQTARVHALTQLGLRPPYPESGLGPILASTSCQFKRQLFFPGRVTVVSRIGPVRTTSVHLNHLVLDDQGEVAAEAHDVLVWFDFRANRKHPVPEAFRAQVHALHEPPDGPR